ncbi:outer membrane beta-barrel protein [Elizabethkingia argentiflava]|uniref:Outer membrane beta-barrel protein n=1 Tax=Elizabethkingia argenteiflava TaxID=2681556 RepID=A0A845PXM2_9FLAO|nr:outer membrane beta-barrel family protein [Elizabethkingia argenteiflava]NAW51983.1 outer membrane beta-barrel protein [Elizabethkingia argenteiflava]
MQRSHLIFAGIISFSVSTFAQQRDTPDIPQIFNNTDKEIQHVHITKIQKPVEYKPDRTIINLSGQPHLSSGSTLEGIKQLPGILVSDMAGIIYQGKQLSIYMDGQPLNISRNELISFLEGMPANSIDKIEVITQPGAEFPATAGQAILNIITHHSAKNYLTATYSTNYRFSNYDKFRNTLNNNIALSSRNKWMGWQLTAGHSYRESFRISQADDILNSFYDRYLRGYFTKLYLRFNIGKDLLLLNYNFNPSHDKNDIQASGIQIVNKVADIFQDTGNSKNLSYRHEGVVNYQKKFNNPDQKLDVTFSYTNYRNQFRQSSYFTSPNHSTFVYPENKVYQNIYNFKVDYTQPIPILDGGKINLGGTYEKLDYKTLKASLKNLDYHRQSTSMYSEVISKYKNFDFTAGIRAESYDIYGTTVLKKEGTSEKLPALKKSKLFPNARIQYNFTQAIKLNLNYSKKISLPDISFLNPNNINYQGSNVDFIGNPFLSPTLYDNIEAKMSVFDYAFISYNLGRIKNQAVEYVKREGDKILYTNTNIDRLKQHNLNIGVPLSLMLFTHSLHEIMKLNFNPDKVNFIYIYGGYQFQKIQNITPSDGLWNFNVTGHFILPKNIRLIASYSYITKGNYYYFKPIFPINNNLNFTLSKKLNRDKLTIALFVNDIFNRNRMSFRTTNETPGVILHDKYDTRNFGLSINYKVPTKNKLAKEEDYLPHTETKNNNIRLKY